MRVCAVVVMGDPLSALLEDIQACNDAYFTPGSVPRLIHLQPVQAFGCLVMKPAVVVVER